MFTGTMGPERGFDVNKLLKFFRMNNVIISRNIIFGTVEVGFISGGLFETTDSSPTNSKDKVLSNRKGYV